MWSKIHTALEKTVEFVGSVMGVGYSQFVSALKQRDTVAALDLYNKKKVIRDAIKPSESLGPEHRGNTVLHYAAQLDLITIYEELLRKDGKPDLRNDDRRNCLHLICQGSGNTDHSVKEKMLRTTVEIGLGGMDLEHVLCEADIDGNTALHLAACAGLSKCVDLLIEWKADLSATNNHNQTPADVATEANHTEIASKLETKILFQNDKAVCSVEPDRDLLNEIANGPMGMKDHDIRSMKDQLLIETSHMLGVSLFIAEVLLRNNNWSKEDLLVAWMTDPGDVCDKAGVELPSDLGVHNLDRSDCAVNEKDKVNLSEKECGVCYLMTPPEVIVPCQHHFCADCWKLYVEERISSGEIENISCPEYGCYRLVSQSVIERVVSNEMGRKFLSYDIKAFVDSNPNMSWCPRPGCGQAVTLPSVNDIQTSPPSRLEEDCITVHCGNDHYFCWRCRKNPHEPCTCALWQRWLNHVEEMKPRVGDTTAAEANEAASSKWLADRSKPCPNCKSPIEKNEGCNHICCRKCKHNFCWVCLDNWRCHNSSTGGYFECNRYDVQKKAGDILTQRRDAFYGDAREWEIISRFLHYYERYNEHLNSLSLEEPFLDKARYKMKQLEVTVLQLESVAASAFEPLDMSFIEIAVRELLKCRRVLQATYPYAYYIMIEARKRRFELVQGTLEQVTEMLAEVVARPHMRKSRSEIIELTREARSKRLELLEVKDTIRDSPPPPVSHHSSSQRPFTWLRDDRDDYITRRQKRSEISSDSGPPQQQDEDELLQALEMSRQEFVADKKLKEDVERAKEESMQVTLVNNGSNSFNNDWIPPATMSVVRDQGQLVNQAEDTNWLRRLVLSNDEQLSWPILRLDSPPSPPLPRTPSPPLSGQLDLQYPTHVPSLTSSSPCDNGDPMAEWQPVFNGDHVAEWGPVFNEDEDLKRAIQLSMQTETATQRDMDIVGTQISERSKVSTNLPPELVHLLETQRTGEHV